MEPSAVRFAQDGSNVIEGLMIPFHGPFPGDKDHYQTRFSEATEYALDWFESRPLLYNHALPVGRSADPGPGLRPIGRITELSVRSDVGVWAKAQLDASHDYFDAVKELIGQDALFFSHATLEHLMKVDARSGDVLQWPVVEGTLTPVPANPYAAIPVHSFRAAYRGIDVDPATLERIGNEEAEVVGPDTVRAKLTPPETAVRADVSTVERSYEDIRDDITDLLNPAGPFDYGMVYSHVVATYADHVIVCRCEDGEDETYWSIPYTLDDTNEPMLGTAEQVEAAYVPVTTRSTVTPLTLEASRLTRLAATLTERTKDLGERRTAEGRVLSTANLRSITDAHRSMGETHTALGTLLTSSTRAAEQQAKASDPQTWTGQLAELELLSLLTD